MFMLCACGPARDPEAEGTAFTLRRGLGAEPDTLDPQLAEDNAALTVLADLYEGLTTESSDGRIVAGSAASWRVSQDGLSYTFDLRPELRWSNGDPVTASHFEAGLRRAMAPATAAPNAGLLEAIDRIEVPDERTLRIHLRRPVPYLPALLALPVAAPLHPRATDLDPRPVNGAFRLVDRRPGEAISLERNPDYWDRDAVALERVVHVVVADLNSELNLYRTGELDLTSEVPNSQLELLRDSAAGELRVSPYLSVYSYVVNLARITDARARTALALAVDRDRVTRQVTGAGERPAFGWVPDGMSGYRPARYPWHSLNSDGSVAEARRLWTDARRSGAAPSRVTLCTDASANHRRTAVAIADFWRTALDVQTEIVELEWSVYLDARHHPGDCDLVRLGWSADFVDPEAFLAIFETNHPQNTLGYSSASYDELLARSRIETEAGQRLELLRRAEARLLQDSPVIPIFFRVSKRLVKPYVRGVGDNPLGHVASRHLRIEELKKGAGD